MAPASGRSVDVVADLVVVGGGLIGLAVAASAAERGLSVVLFAVDLLGAASRAAAGLLVPHYGRHAGPAERFMTASRDAYPAYLRWVEERSGIRVPCQASGAIEVARSDEEREQLWRAAPTESERLTSALVAALEPTLAPTAGGVLHPRDGAVDNVRLTDALATVVAGQRRIRTVREAAAAAEFGCGAATITSNAGTRAQGKRLVLAAGAWSPTIGGLPRAIPVRPLRGQLCTLRTAPLRHIVLGRDVYLATRGGDRTLAGSTMEDVGFDAGTTTGAIDALRESAATLCAPLRSQFVVEAWSGLRPVTPDFLPILGPDPDEPRLIYACGHSRNGILLAPVTAAVISALADDEDPGWDLSAFSILRFASRAVD